MRRFHLPSLAGPIWSAGLLVACWLTAMAAVVWAFPLGDDRRDVLLAVITLGGVALGVAVLPLAPADLLIARIRSEAIDIEGVCDRFDGANARDVPTTSAPHPKSALNAARGGHP